MQYSEVKTWGKQKDVGDDIGETRVRVEMAATSPKQVNKDLKNRCMCVSYT